MPIFWGEPKDDSLCPCGCGYTLGQLREVQEIQSGGLVIKLLGKNCDALEEHLNAALAALDLTADVKQVTGFMKIAAFGVSDTPALVINGRVCAQGDVPSVEAVKALLAPFQKT